MEVKEGYKQTDIGLIPADWNVKELGEIATIKRGKFTPRPRNDPRFYGGNIPFVQTGDVTNSNGRIANFSQTLNADGLSVSVLFKKGTILMTIAANIGYTGILQVDMACPDSLVAIDGGKNNNNIFLNQYFIYKRQSLDKLSTSGAQKNLNIELLRPFPIPLPPTKAEQTAIATVLSDNDALISRLETLIEKKRAIKQGAMQQLLKPKEGWVLKKLGEVATLKARIGWQGLTTAEYKSIGDYALITGTEFLNGFVDWDSCHFVEFERYKQDKNIQVRENDVLVTKDGTIGKVAFLKKVPVPATLNSGVFVIRPVDQAFYPAFFYYVLMSEHFTLYLSQLTAGSTISHLYQKDFVHFRFMLPSTYEEQIRIAQILSDMDAEIAELEQKSAKYKLVKHGMMQELLTGKTRLV